MIALDNVTQFARTSGSGTDVRSHTITSNTNGILVVYVIARDASLADLNVSGVTFNGVALTKQHTGVSAARYGQAELWYLLTPPVGTYDIEITYDGFCTSRSGGAVSFTGVDQSTPFEGNNTANGNTDTASLSVTTTVDGAMILGAIWTDESNSSAVDPITDATEDFDDDSYTPEHFVGVRRSAATAGTYSIGATWSGSEEWVITAAALLPVSGGGGGTSGIKSIAGVTQSTIGNVAGVAEANIASVAGVTN